MDRQTDRRTDIYIELRTERWGYRKKDGCTDEDTSRSIERQAGSRWTNVQTDKKTDTERERQAAYKQIFNQKELRQRQTNERTER